MYFLILFLYLLELYYRISGHHVSRFEALVMRKNEAIRPIIKGIIIFLFLLLLILFLFTGNPYSSSPPHSLRTGERWKQRMDFLFYVHFL